MIFVVKPIEADDPCPTEGYLGYLYVPDIQLYRGKEVDLNTGAYNLRIGKLSGRKYKSWRAGAGLAYCNLPHTFYYGGTLGRYVREGRSLETIITGDLKTTAMRWAAAFNCVLEPVSVIKEEDLWE